MKKVIDEEKEKSGRQNRTLWNTTIDGEGNRSCAVNNYRYKAIRQKARNKFTEGRSKAIRRKLG